MTRIRVGASVHCTDGQCGELVALVVDPATRTVSHYVVRVKSDSVERMVPAVDVAASHPDALELRCTLADVNAMKSFTRDEILSEVLPDPAALDYRYSYYYGWGIPDVVPPDPSFIHVQSDRVPEGEMGLRKGTKVYARDGEVGEVSTLELDDAGVITHFAIDKSHAELMLPVSTIDFIDEDGVHLKLTKAAVHGLPTMPTGHGRFSQTYRRMELVAKVFSEPSKAHETLEYLEYMAHSPGHPLRIREAAELIRDMDGTPHIVQSSQPSLAKGAVVGGAAGGLLTLLGPLGFVAGAAIGAGLGAAAGPKMDMGFPDAFLDRLEDRLEPGHSALVVLVEHDFARDLTDALADSDKVIGGQQIVDTLIQELLVDAPVASQSGDYS